MNRNVAAILMALILAGCKVGPNYKRPDVPAPPAFRSADAQTTASSLGETKWFDIFDDEALRTLIKQALQANYDIRIAAQRVLQAEGQLQATRSRLFPQLNAGASATRTGTNAPITSGGLGFASAAWEIDLFGKLRRATEAARADLLSVEENQKAVMQALVAQTAAAYFDLLAYDAALIYVDESIKTRLASLDLVKARAEGGVASILEVDQAQTLLSSAQSSLALIQKAQEQTENFISYLIATPPGPIARGKTLTAQSQPPQVPAGLPSALLERRPDIRTAEQQLVAANARVGVAKAAFFPSINLTGTAGYGTTDLLGIASRSGFAYSMGGFVDLPIFDAGRRQGNYKVAQAVREELVVNYQKTIQGAFREVADNLVGYQKNKEYAASQKVLTETLRHQSQMADMRYVGGVTSYLEVLDTERQRLTAEQDLALAQRDVLTSLVQLYKSLGGGWQQ